MDLGQKYLNSNVWSWKSALNEITHLQTNILNWKLEILVDIRILNGFEFLTPVVYNLFFPVVDNKISARFHVKAPEFSMWLKNQLQLSKKLCEYSNEPMNLKCIIPHTFWHLTRMFLKQTIIYNFKFEPSMFTGNNQLKIFSIDFFFFIYIYFRLHLVTIWQN